MGLPWIIATLVSVEVEGTTLGVEQGKELSLFVKELGLTCSPWGVAWHRQTRDLLHLHYLQEPIILPLIHNFHPL